MPEEIANNIKEETYYKCTQCLPAVAFLPAIAASASAGAKEGGEEIFWNIHRKFTYCGCLQGTLYKTRGMGKR